MIFEWMDNDAIDRPSQVMNIIYDLKMVTKRQLLAITGLEEQNLNRIFKLIRQKPSETSIDWLQTAGIRHKNTEPCRFVYTLGKKAIQYVQQQRKQDVRVREAPSAQMFHFVGLNSILQRAIEAYGRDNIAWYSEGEQADLLYLRLKSKEHGESERRSIIRPDARIRIGDKEWMVEYDNDTEGPKQLEIKFHRYVELYERLELNTPILWVTTSQKRKEYLKKNWDATMQVTYPHHPNKPISIFALEGEETQLFRPSERVGKVIPSLR